MFMFNIYPSVCLLMDTCVPVILLAGKGVNNNSLQGLHNYNWIFTLYFRKSCKLYKNKNNNI